MVEGSPTVMRNKIVGVTRNSQQDTLNVRIHPNARSVSRLAPCGRPGRASSPRWPGSRGAPRRSGGRSRSRRWWPDMRSATEWREPRTFTLSRPYPESARIAAEPVDRSGLPEEVSRTWILTTRDRALSVASQHSSIEALGGVSAVIPVDWCHEVIISHPERLAQILIERGRLHPGAMPPVGGGSV
jgi:hypothetical protein